MKNDLIFVSVSAAIALARLVPPALLGALGRILGACAYRVCSGARRTAHENIRLCLATSPHQTQLVARQNFRRLGGYLGETVSLLLSRPLKPLRIDAESRRVLEEALDLGRGVLFASAHLGPWERVALTLVSEGFPLVALVRESYDPRLTRLYDRLRVARGVSCIYRGEPGAAAKLLRTLRRGGLLGIPMDLNSRVPSIEAELLGQRAETPVGPARLALRTGAAVVVGTFADGDCVSVRRISTDDLSAGTGEKILTQRINDELSARIRRAPEEWVWMHPRFAGTLQDRLS